MFYPVEVVEEVRGANDIVDVVSAYVRLGRRGGGNYFGPCPFHREKTPSFSVNADKQIYYCFGCGAGGNVIGFVMQIENYGFPEALKALADRVHYALPEASGEDAAEYARRAKEKERIFEINKAAARFFYDCLQTREGAVAVRYMDSRRLGAKARAKFGLGYSPMERTSLLSFLKGKGYAEAEIQRAGLALPDRSGNLRDRFYGRLMFPIIESTGGIVGFGGRILADGEPKYLNSPDTPVFDKSRNLYGIQFARKAKSKTIMVVEGYMDVISLFQAGFENAVAALGTAFNAGHVRLLRKYCEEAVLLFDSDEAGTKAALRAIPIFRDNGMPAKVLQVTDAKDPDEYITKFGAGAFEKLLKTADTDVRFRVSRLLAGFDMAKTDERVKFTAEAAKIIAGLDSAIERDAYGKEVAELAGVSADAVNREAGKEITKEAERAARQRRFSDGSGTYRDKPRPESGAEEAKKRLIYRISADAGVYAALYANLPPAEMGGGVYERLLALVYDFYAKGKEIRPAELINYFESAEEQKAVSAVFRASLGYEGRRELEKEVNEMLKVVKTAYIDERMRAAELAELRDLVETKRNMEKLYISISDG